MGGEGGSGGKQFLCVLMHAPTRRVWGYVPQEILCSEIASEVTFGTTCSYPSYLYIFTRMAPIH